MSKLPKTRQQLRDWCLRELGEPVIQVNIDEDQIQDRLTEAIDYFQQFHFEGVERVFLKHQITASTMTFDSALAAAFSPGEDIVGQTSGAVAEYIDDNTDLVNTVRFATKKVEENVNNAFIDGEPVIGAISGSTGTLAASNAIVLGDVDNCWIPLSDEIISVNEVYPLSSSGYLFQNQFYRYQWALANTFSLINSDLISYDMWKRNLALWEFELGNLPRSNYNRLTDRLSIDSDWNSSLVDTFVIVDAQRSLDPTQYGEVYCNYFVRKYATELLRKQWAWNLMKYEGIQLPGGVTLNAERILSEAKIEIEKLEERIRKEFQNPVDFQVG